MNRTRTHTNRSCLWQLSIPAAKGRRKTASPPPPTEALGIPRGDCAACLLVDLRCQCAVVVSAAEGDAGGALRRANAGLDAAGADAADDFLPVLISLHLKRRARGAKYAATLVSSGIRGEEDARALLSRLPGRVHLYPNRIVHAGNRSECDLVALCRRGATVIEVKNHAGTVTGDLSDHDLLLTRKTAQS